MTLTDLGEAKMIKNEYENMRNEKDAAISRANSWLIVVAVLLGLLMVCIVALPFLLMKHSIKGKQIDAAMQMAERLPSTEREMLAYTFCRPIITQKVDKATEYEATE